MLEYDPTFTTSLSDNSLIVNKTGWYALSGGVWLSANVSGYKYLYLADVEDDQTPLIRSDHRSATDRALSMAGSNYLEAGTKLIMRLYSASATNPVGNAKGTYTYMRAVYLSGGPKGDTGIQGPVGPQGETGPQGPKGDQGAPSEGAYQDWLAAGNVGTLNDFMISLRGMIVLYPTDPIPAGTLNGTLIYRRQ